MIIPSHPFYGITKDAVVYDLRTGEIVEEVLDRYGNRCVRLSKKIKGKVRATNQKLSKLLLRTYKPYKDKKLDDAWLSVSYIDGDIKNVTLENIQWDETWYHPHIVPGRDTDPFGIWIPVPGYAMLEITLDPHPKIRRADTQYILPIHIDNGGYSRINTTLTGAIRVHRLVGLTFLSHPLDVSDLILNHKDGVRTNYSLSNLEWITPPENALHAVYEGARKDKLRKIVAYCVETRDTKTFPGLSAAGRYFGKEAGTIRQVLVNPNKNIWNGHILRYEDESDIRTSSEAESVTMPQIAVKDLASGEVVVYSGYKAVTKSLGISTEALWRVMTKKVPVPRYNKLFQMYSGNELTWPEYPKEIIEVFNRCKTNDIPYQVTSPSGEVHYVVSLKEWASQDSSRPTVAAVRASVYAYGSCQGYVFKRINLEEYHPDYIPPESEDCNEDLEIKDELPKKPLLAKERSRFSLCEDTRSPIPGHPGYSITHDGVVKKDGCPDPILEKIGRNKGGWSVRIKKNHWFSNQRIDKLILRTFSPYEVDPELDTAWLSVKYLDGNKDNLILGNIEWDDSWYYPPRIPGENCDFGVWCEVPGYPDLQVTLTPEPKIRETKRYRNISFSRPDNDYPIVLSLKNRISLHRLLSLAFIPHPTDPSDLLVNHIDSDVTNFSITNLEWTTPSGNNIHSTEFGVRGHNSRKIEAYDINTGNVLIFKGIGEAQRHFNVSPGTLDSVLKFKKNRGNPWRGYIFKFEDENISWDDLRQMTNFRGIKGKGTKVSVKYLESGEVRTYPGINILCENEEICSGSLKRLLAKKHITPKNNKLFQIYHENMTWPDYPPEIIDVFNKANGNSTPLKIERDDGHIDLVPNISSWKPFGIEIPDTKSLQSYIRKKGYWRNYVFKPIDLSEYN